VDQLQRADKAKGVVRDHLTRQATLNNMEQIIEDLDLKDVLDRELHQLSGGELQRFAIAMVCIQKGDIFMFDEPSSYLDVKQRLKAAKIIRSMIDSNRYIICVEHDLSVLDYLSDFVCCLYGRPSVYGVVTLPFGVREGKLLLLLLLF
jgi:ATP-binding cassette subfamily E protein 1